MKLEPQLFVSAYLKKRNKTLLVKIHNSDSIKSFASILVIVFQFLKYNADVGIGTFLKRAIDKLAPKLKES